MWRMDSNAKTRSVDLSDLRVMKYPDPRLRKICIPVDAVDTSVRALVERMWELMLSGRGVGLAAPQVGLTVRLFVASPDFGADDLRVYVNPEIIDARETFEADEGCLSFPGIHCNIKRSRIVTVRALGLRGEQFEETVEDLGARIVQHEIDHLDGRLLVDRMSTVARLANRRVLKELEEQFQAA